MENLKVTPVILTCGTKIDSVKEFVASYVCFAADHLRQPVVVVDISLRNEISKEYLELILQLNPRLVTIHPKLEGECFADSVQDAAFFSLKQALTSAMDTETHVLFMEDDIIFSPQFGKAIKEANYSPDIAFYTFYQPGNGYSYDTETGRIHENSDGRFYGTQCIMFPNESVHLILNNREDMESRHPGGYDLRWSRCLTLDHAKVGWTSKQSYVQHCGTVSRIGSMQHVSNNFVAASTDSSTTCIAQKDTDLTTTIYRVNNVLSYVDSDRSEEALSSDVYYTEPTDSLSSAEVVVPVLVDTFRPRSVIDIGCGLGAWVKEFEKSGVQVAHGLDTAQVVTNKEQKLKLDSILAVDLQQPINFIRRYDIAICLEVGEHLPASASDTLVDTLVKASDTVIFSAAIPGQGGIGHINERFPIWWDKRFKYHGYTKIEAIGKKFAGNPKVAWWYTNNMVVYSRYGKASKFQS
jgi:GR25 family glycosyltransferase involved in LPS biosynthesis